MRKIRWNRLMKPRDTVGLIYIEVHTGRFHMQAQVPLKSEVKVMGETLDDLRYDIDYQMARKDVVKQLRKFADEVESNSEIVDVFEVEP